MSQLEIIPCDGKCDFGKYVCGSSYLCIHNNLLILQPDLCKEWDYERNIKSPSEYTSGSGQKQAMAGGYVKIIIVDVINDRHVLSTEFIKEDALFVIEVDKRNYVHIIIY